MYKFKCPHCGSTEGLIQGKWGGFGTKTTKFDKIGCEKDEVLISQNIRDFVEPDSCAACGEELTEGCRDDYLVEVEEESKEVYALTCDDLLELLVYSENRYNENTPGEPLAQEEIVEDWLTERKKEGGRHE